MNNKHSAIVPAPRQNIGQNIDLPTVPTIAITCGEPAGIGPEIAIRAAWECRADVHSVLIGDRAFLTQLAYKIDPAIRVDILDCPLNAPVMPGQLDVRNAVSVLQTLDIAIEQTLQKRFAAIVTAPLQKSLINQAGISFTGHTEYLAQKTHAPHVVMMLASNASVPPLRVALATTHLPLHAVSAALTVESLLRTLTILHHDLRKQFGLAQPRILATGLNPHAGESGHIGREEIDIILPALQAAQAQGIAVSGPYPADTLFQPKYLQNADCVLAMYHDQGLPVLKYASFGHGVNITLGLPLIRTSVDHGTALDIAAQGIGRADHGSMVEAIKTAAYMANACQTHH